MGTVDSTDRGATVFGLGRHDGKAVVTADTSWLSGEQLAVLEGYQAMQQAMVAADHEALRCVIEDGTYMVHMSGARQTKEEFIAEVGNELTYYHSDIERIDAIVLDGDWATLDATVALTANAYGARGTFPVHVHQDMHKVDGRWLFSRRRALA